MTVRDYAAGDAMKYIQWKASAREQKLKTRNMTGEEHRGLLLFYDTGRYAEDPYAYLPIENQILEIVLGTGYFFAGQNVKFEVLYHQSTLHRVNVEGAGDYDAFYREAAQTVFDKNESGCAGFTELIRQGAFTDKKAVIAVLGRIDEELMAAAEGLAMTGVTVILYIVTYENIERYQKEKSSRLHILAVPVYEDLEEWL